MSAAPISNTSNARAHPGMRSGALALMLLRFTLIGVVLALVGTLGNVALNLLGS